MKRNAMTSVFLVCRNLLSGFATVKSVYCTTKNTTKKETLMEADCKVILPMEETTRCKKIVGVLSYTHTIHTSNIATM